MVSGNDILESIQPIVGEIEIRLPAVFKFELLVKPLDIKSVGCVPLGADAPLVMVSSTEVFTVDIAVQAIALVVPMEKQIAAPISMPRADEVGSVVFKEYRSVLVRIHTDAGIRGIGDTYAGGWFYPKAAKALLEKNPDPTEEETRYWLAGNLCRCTGYDKIIRAVLDAAAEMNGANGATLNGGVR